MGAACNYCHFHHGQLVSLDKRQRSQIHGLVTWPFGFWHFWSRLMELEPCTLVTHEFFSEPSKRLQKGLRRLVAFGKKVLKVGRFSF